VVLLLKEEDVRALLPMDRAVELVERAFRLEGEGAAFNATRTRLRYPHGLLNYMAGAVEPDRAVGLKAYDVSRHGARFVALLFDSESGSLAGIVEADWLGRIRTGAASGVATRFLARADARVAGVFGSGSQAQTQIEALLAVRPIELVKIYTRNPNHRTAFAESLNGRLNCEVRAVQSAEEALKGSDIITTITTAAEPLFNGRMLEPGTHVNAAGSNRPTSREIDVATVARSAVVAVDSPGQAKIESGDLIPAVELGQFDWNRATPLSDIVSGNAPGRTDAKQITLFESLGVGIEDVAVATWVVAQARKQGRGLEVDFGAARD